MRDLIKLAFFLGKNGSPATSKKILEVIHTATGLIEELAKRMRDRSQNILALLTPNSFLLSFVAWYFPFIDEPLIIKYRQRIYQPPLNQKRYRFAEDFFVTTDCLQCPKNYCKRNWALALGFESVWQDRADILKIFHAKKYPLYLNDKRMHYYIGKTGYAYKFQQEKNKKRGLTPKRN